MQLSNISQINIGPHHTAWVLCPQGVPVDPNTTIRLMDLSSDAIPQGWTPIGMYHAVCQQVTLDRYQTLAEWVAS